MNQKFQLINVLMPTTYNDCHIKDSINVPLDKLADYVRELPKDSELIVYCASYICPVSKRAWRLLTELGFTNVYAYEGGMAEWYQKGYPTGGPCNEDYLKKQYTKSEHEGEPIKEITAEDLKTKLNF